MTTGTAQLHRDRLTVMTREDGLFTFWQPPTVNGYFQWWDISNGVLSVVVTDHPRRSRCFPLVSVEWWEIEHNAEVPS